MPNDEDPRFYSDAWWNVANITMDGEDRCEDWCKIRDAGKLGELLKEFYWEKNGD
jgi:hypothetical protein